MNGKIYALRHKVSQKFLIGSTTNADVRRAFWKQNFFYNRLPKAVAAVSTKFDDWEIVVLGEMSVASPEDRKLLRFLETRAIVEGYLKHPERSLNKSRFGFGPQDRAVAKSTYYYRLAKGYTPEMANLQRQPGWSKKTKVIGDDGKEMVNADAARELGCLPKTLAKRLRNWRRTHPHSDAVSLLVLRGLTQQHRKV